jgi:hypothetical protein
MAPFLTRYIGANLVKHLVIAGCVGNYKLIFRDVSLIKRRWPSNSIFRDDDLVHYSDGSLF